MMKRTSLVDVAVEKLKEYITIHQFENGDKLPSEKLLIEKLGVSRTVVREAVSRLQQSGLIEVKSGSGMYITEKDKHLSMLFESHMKVHGFKIKELLEVRKIIELGAIRLIIEGKLNVDSQKLKDINKKYYDSIKQADQLALYDSIFHETIILFTKNQTLISMSKVIKEYFSKNPFNKVVVQEDIEKSFYEHSKIIEAIESLNLILAHEIMNNHLSRVFEWIEDLERKS